jgi:hypothetical protein
MRGMGNGITTSSIHSCTRGYAMITFMAIVILVTMTVAVIKDIEL